MPDENSSKQTGSVKLADTTKQTSVEKNARLLKLVVNSQAPLN